MVSLRSQSGLKREFAAEYVLFRHYGAKQYDSLDCLDIIGIFRRQAHLLSYRTDQVVNALTAVETALPPDPFIDQFPGKDDRGIAGQEIEELELQSCKGELTSAHCDPLAQGPSSDLYK